MEEDILEDKSKRNGATQGDQCGSFICSTGVCPYFLPLLRSILDPVPRVPHQKGMKWWQLQNKFLIPPNIPFTGKMEGNGPGMTEKSGKPIVGEI